MSRERRLLKGLQALLLITLCPMQATAQDDEWVRVDVFGGRASVEVPKSYKKSVEHQLGLPLETTKNGRDGFYIDGMRDDWIRIFEEPFEKDRFWSSSQPDDMRAHIAVIELSNDPESSHFKKYLSAGGDSVMHSAGPEFSLSYKYNDRGFIYWGGVFHTAVAFAVCGHPSEHMVCVSGMDMIEHVSWARSAKRRELGELDAEALRNSFQPAANGLVIEQVMKSFRYK